jgi:tRNA dimethylallyltransferase
MIRALEVARYTGEPISHRQVQFEHGRRAENCLVFSLAWPRGELHNRINRRVQQMFADGLVDEIRGLLDRHGELSRTASQAVGYREVMDWIRGGGELEQTIEAVAAHTRQLARRQETWLRSFSEIEFIDVEEPMDPGDVARRIHEIMLQRGFEHRV